MPKPFVIALDGPAASGKSTVGLGVARELGFFYLDTGLLYRALTWLALQRGLDLGDGAALAELAGSVRLAARPRGAGEGRTAVLVDGRDVSAEVASPAVDASVSIVAGHPEVRRALLGAQRAAIRAPGTVLAGRDIGTVIAPDAPLKVWLDASVEERARRRSRQTGEPRRAVLETLAARDQLDRSRAAAPMARAEDAVALDTERSAPEAIVSWVVALARERLGRRPT